MIYETCNQLNPPQVQKILTMYTPGDQESKMPASVIRQVVERGSVSSATGVKPQLMMNVQRQFDVVFPFVGDPTDFAAIKLPKNLTYLKVSPL